MNNVTYEGDIEDVNLIKWPAFIVRGETVSKELAAEILIRTDTLHFRCNDKTWTRTVNELFGLVDYYDAGMNEKSSSERWKHYSQQEVIRQSYRPLDVEDLSNNQIMSSWVSGPDDGWMGWDGTIRNPDGKNIGKWPSVEAVAGAWGRIAAEWPSLNLRCQLWNCEAWYPVDGVKPEPVVEFVVTEGRVHVFEPTEVLAWPRNGQFNRGIAAGRLNEAGVDYKTLKWAVDLVKERVAGEQS